MRPLPALATIALLFLAGQPLWAAEPDVVLADFEGSDYGTWVATGEAFGNAPARGTLPGQMAVAGFVGKGLVNSFRGGDAATGKLSSPEFAVERKFITFLIGGGGSAGKTCVNLVVDGQVVRTATGPNTAPGGSEELSVEAWDVAEFAGKRARFEIIDTATGGWGHINVDHIALTDTKPPGLLVHAEREFVCEKKVLNLPVKTGAKKRRVRFVVEDQTVREFEIELADAEPDFWVPLDLAVYRGKRAKVVVDRLPENSGALSAMEQSDELKGSENLYREPLRPQFHFSSRRGWLNDPNGLVFSAGEYHLYYQHNPYGWDWGNMHWGHAVSADLVHWKELPIAIYPRKFNDWAFSGSAVVDRENTSGWKTGTEELLVGAYTSTGRGECIVYSNDRGRTWTEFKGNPVVKHEGRDPRLLWHAPTKRWVMALYNEHAGKRWITFHTSPDLKTWAFTSRIEGFYECPDLFELPVDGDAKKTRWVLTGASSEYMIGSFDGREFHPETSKLPGHRGEAFYAAQTFTNEPRGRIVQIGWGQIKMPGMPFNQMMCFPTELSLRTTADGVRLCWQPVREIENLRGRSRTLAAGETLVAEKSPELLDVRAEFTPGEAGEIGFDVRGVAIRYDVAKQELTAKNHRVPLPLADGKLRLTLLIERTSLELFANDGSVYVPLALPLDGRDKPVRVVPAADARSVIAVHELSSIWESGKATR